MSNSWRKNANWVQRGRGILEGKAGCKIKDIIVKIIQIYSLHLTASLLGRVTKTGNVYVYYLRYEMIYFPDSDQ